MKTSLVAFFQALRKFFSACQHPPAQLTSPGCKPHPFALPQRKMSSFMNETIPRIPSTEKLLFLWDNNARLGAEGETWPTCLSPCRRGKINKNSQNILEIFCFCPTLSTWGKVAQMTALFGALLSDRDYRKLRRPGEKNLPAKREKQRQPQQAPSPCICSICNREARIGLFSHLWTCR